MNAEITILKIAATANLMNYRSTGRHHYLVLAINQTGIALAAYMGKA